MGTDVSVNLCVIRTGKCRTPITKFKVDAASGRNIVRRGPISVNQAPAWKCCLVEPCNMLIRFMDYGNPGRCSLLIRRLHRQAAVI